MVSERVRKRVAYIVASACVSPMREAIHTAPRMRLHRACRYALVNFGRLVLGRRGLNDD